MMETLERGESPAAAQPPGLTVQMRPYQLQSLRAMQELEDGEGGESRVCGRGVRVGLTHSRTHARSLCYSHTPACFRRLFWLTEMGADGKRFWYSLAYPRTHHVLA